MTGLGEEAGVGRRLVRNSGLILGARILTAATSLVAVPVMVSRLGVAGFGTWEALFAAASVAAMFQSAVSGTLLWRLSEAYGRGDRDEAVRWIRGGLLATLLLSLVLVPVALLAARFVVRLLNVPGSFAAVATWLFPCLVAVIVFGGAADTLESAVSGFQRAGSVSVTAAGAMMVNYALVIAGLLAGWGLASCLIGVAGGMAVRIGAAYVLARNAIGRFTLIPGLPPQTPRTTVHYSGLLLIGYASAALRDQTDKIILSGLASPVWAGYYGIASRLASVVLEFSRFFYNPMLTTVAALNAGGNWGGIRRLYDAVMTVTAVATGCVAALVGGLYDRLLVLWLGHNVPEVPLLLLLLLAGNTCNVMLTGPGTSLVRGIGRVGIETKYVAVSLVCNLVLTITLVLLVGPVGTVIASGTTWAIASVVFTFALHHAVKLPGAATRRAVLVLGCALVAAILAWALSSLFPASTSRAASLEALVGLALPAVGFYVVLLVLTGAISRATIAMIASVLGRQDAEGIA